jgi:hypothetical protein
LFQKANKAEFAQLVKAARPRKDARQKNEDDQQANQPAGHSASLAVDEVMVVEDSE